MAWCDLLNAGSLGSAGDGGEARMVGRGFSSFTKTGWLAAVEVMSMIEGLVGVIMVVVELRV